MDSKIFNTDNFNDLKSTCLKIIALANENVDGQLMASQLIMLAEGIKSFNKNPIVSNSGINNTFPKFWYESNAVWGYVGSIVSLRDKIYHQTNKEICGQFKDKEEFLDNSFQNVDGSLDFGTRSEHWGNKTLREFLVENEVDLSEL